MKKFFAFAIIIALFGLNACKKKEEQAQQPSAQQPAAPEFKPAEKKKKNGKGEKPAPSALKIFQDTTLVKTVPQNEYAVMAPNKIKVGAKQLNGISLKELLAKNNIKNGKSVTLAGQTVSAQLTWEQANSSDLVIFMTPKKVLKIQAGKSLAGVKFPKRLDSITVSATDVAAKAPEKKPATNK